MAHANAEPAKAISWSPIVFAAGCARSTTVVQDFLTLEPMRRFATPAPRQAPRQDWDAAGQILADKGLVVIVVGDRMLMWKVGPWPRVSAQEAETHQCEAKRHH